MLAYIFLVIAIVFRFVPHAWHFTPVGAALLFFGAKQPRSRMWIPLALMLAGDVALNLFKYHYPVGIETFTSVLWYAAYILIGSVLVKKTTIARVAGASLSGSLAFFLISNFLVWMGGTMYPMTLAGLGQCFTLALPFFDKTVVGDLMYSAVMFATPVVIAAWQQRGARTAAA